MLCFERGRKWQAVGKGKSWGKGRGVENVVRYFLMIWGSPKPLKQEGFVLPTDAGDKRKNFFYETTF